MAYSYSRSVTVDNTKVSGSNHTDFPVLISGTYDGTAGEPDLRTAANGGKVQNASGFDVAFYSDSALTTQLNHETERYTETTGEVIYWVKIPSLLDASDTVFYMAYGNSAISSTQEHITDTWNSDFKRVLHLPDGTTLGALDSTSNAGDGTIIGSTAVAGKVGGGANFDGSDTISIAAGYLSGISTYTFEVWIKSSANALEEIFRVGFDGQHFIRNNGSGNISFIPNTDFSNGITSATDFCDGTWKYLAVVQDTSNNYIYLNGVQDATSANSGEAGGSGTAGYIGSVSNNSEFWNGQMDEFRISGVPRSVGWILTTYNNQSAPATFYSIGAEVAPGVPMHLNNFKFVKVGDGMSTSEKIK